MLMSIGIDASYTRSGVAVAVDGEVILSFSFPRLEWNEGKKKVSESRLSFRKRFKVELENMLNDIIRDLDQEVRVYFEPNNYQNMVALIANAELFASIEDLFDEWDLEITLLQASKWQSAIGRKPKDVLLYSNERKPKKMPVIRYVEDVLGIDCKEKDEDGKDKIDKDGRYWYEDDIADAIVMAMFPFIVKKK